jgi:hypothetical protein
MGGLIWKRHPHVRQFTEFELRRLSQVGASIDRISAGFVSSSSLGERTQIKRRGRISFSDISV